MEVLCWSSNPRSNAERSPSAHRKLVLRLLETIHMSPFRLHPTRWEARAAWGLKTAVLATAAIHLVGGDLLYGLFCLVAVVLAMVPAFLARTTRANLPIEVEIAFLSALAADMTLGHLAGLYLAIPWYDKALHLGTSMLIGMVAFLAVYILHFIGRSRSHPWIDGGAILLLTLGLGAAWEIGEYAADGLFHRVTQGAPGLYPLDDTMWDLILDGAGGVLGAFLGPLYMQRSRRSRLRIEAFARIVAQVERRPRRQRERRARDDRAIACRSCGLSPPRNSCTAGGVGAKERGPDGRRRVAG
jgi:hypothetical protein